MTKELTKVDQRELHTLAKSINDREASIQQLRSRTEDAASITVAEAKLQGRELLQAKARLPHHGLWLQWLAANCPLVKARQATNYMRVAKDIEISTGADSIKATLRMISDRERLSGECQKKIMPDYLRSLYLCSQWTDFVSKKPMDSYPEETKSEMRKELGPVVTLLWPDKFAAAV